MNYDAKYGEIKRVIWPAGLPVSILTHVAFSERKSFGISALYTESVINFSAKMSKYLHQTAAVLICDV